MSKTKTTFVCKKCDYNAVQWAGKCPSCNSWNSLEEITIKKGEKTSIDQEFKSKPLPLFAQTHSTNARFSTLDPEFDRILGGGIIPGALILLGGEPGIGKSTLALQIALKANSKVLYVSGEESKIQIEERAKRIKHSNEHLLFLSDTNVINLNTILEEIKPELVIIDSIQTLYNPNCEGTQGNVTQIKECTNQLMQYSSMYNCSFIIIGHVTKGGNIAGPKLLEHMVDVVVYFEGENKGHHRLIRSTKNRYGSIDELGVYEMQNTGLIPIIDASKVFLGSNNSGLSGIAIASVVEGNRPILIEIQSLVSTSQYSTPQRNTNGFESKRLSMIIAVLEKRCGLKLFNSDVFLNVAGGIKASDTSIDLAVCFAIVSSYLNIAIPSGYVFAGEIGLSGEIRAVGRIKARLNDVKRLGFKKLISGINDNEDSKLQQFDSVITAIQSVLK